MEPGNSDGAPFAGEVCNAKPDSDLVPWLTDTRTFPVRVFDWLLDWPRQWRKTLIRRYFPTPAQRVIREKRARSRAEFGRLFDEVAALLFRDDPIGINFEVNKDEYEPEAETILPRLYLCTSEDDVFTVVVEEFDHWFSPTIRPPERYREVSVQIWEAWRNAMLKT